MSSRTVSVSPSRTSASLEKHHRVHPAGQADNRNCGCASTSKGANFPKGTPGRTLYLGVRWGQAVLALVLVALAVVAKVSLQRRKWLSVILSPAITSFFAAFIDAILIHTKAMRATYVQRALHDGALVMGFAIAVGFLTSFSMGDLNGTGMDATAMSCGVAIASISLMVLAMWIHAAVAYGGIKDWALARRARSARTSAV